MVSTTAHGSSSSAASRARSGAAGILLFPVFLSVVVLLTWLRWDFLHSLGWTVLHDGRVAYPSVLARSDLGLLQTANFVLVGVLAAWFGRGLRKHFRHRWSAGAARASLAGVALSGALLAFPIDFPGEVISWHGAVHGVGFLLLLLGCATAALSSALALRGAPGWRGYQVYSLLTAAVAVLTVLTGIMLPRLGQIPFYLTITVLLGWFGVMGARLHQLARAEAASPPASEVSQAGSTS